MREFVTHGYWRRVRERPGILAIAALCLFGPSLLGGLLGVARSGRRRSGVVPGEFQYVTEPRSRGEDWGISVDEQAQFSSEIFTNNIRVTILAFAGGILLGVGALLVLLYNGVMLGATFGLAIGGRQRSTVLPARPRARRAGAELHRRRGRGRPPHRLGDDRSRHPTARRSARAEARAAAEMFLGTALLARASPDSSRASSRRRVSRSASCSVVGFGLGIALLGRRVHPRPRRGTARYRRARALSRR